MDLQSLAFYLFAVIAITGAAMVISSRNPVHSVLFLILVFFNGAGLFLLLGAEFLAMILIVVYVGAVAVMFLFVVMMLDINFAELRQGFLRYLPIAGAVGLVLIGELIFVVAGWQVLPMAIEGGSAPTPPAEQITNTHALGQILYTQYMLLFQLAGIILLIAMIGAIVLTHRQRTGVRRQNIAAQIARRPEESIQVRQIPPGKGLS